MWLSLIAGFIPIFGLALVLALSGTPVARKVALRVGLVDEPTSRKDHTAPIPLLGGLAIYAAVLGSLLLYRHRAEIVGASGLLIGATWISFLGFFDDRHGLRVRVKLLGQAVAVAILVLSGIQVWLPIPLWLNLALTALWVLGITNALNLLDNMDGLSGGVGAVAAASYLLLASLSGQYLVSALAAAILGACLGFLLYNFNPARIFMGDSGSLFVGFLLATLGIKLRFPGQVPWVSWMIPILVLGVPIFDTTLVVLSRLLRGSNPFSSPGLDHLSHRLVAMGWTRRRAVLFHYLLTALLGALALVVSQSSVYVAYAWAALAALVGLAALVFFLSRERNHPDDCAGTLPKCGERARERDFSKQSSPVPEHPGR